MITIEDKLDIFRKMVLQKEEEESKKILSEIEEKNKTILNEHRERLLEKRNEIIQKSIITGELQRDELISEKIVKARKKIFSKKEEVLGDLVLSLEKEAERFVHSKEYEKYLLQEIEKALNNVEDETIVLYLKDEDKFKFSESIIKIGKEVNKIIYFKSPNKSIIGGFLISDKDETYLIDGSFKGKIEENKHLVGEMLYHRLEEAGDILD